MEKGKLKGKRYVIHSYKHSGQLYKTWDEAILLEKTKDFYVFGNNQTKVTEVDGRSWYTKEPAILFFFKDHWFNIIGQCKSRGLTFYCNLTSPFIIEEGAIKYIDYDLDVRIFPSGSFKILDRREYEYHKKKMEYPPQLDAILKKELSVLVELIKENAYYFRKDVIQKYYLQYQKEIEKSEESMFL